MRWMDRGAGWASGKPGNVSGVRVLGRVAGWDFVNRPARGMTLSTTPGRILRDGERVREYRSANLSPINISPRFHGDGATRSAENPGAGIKCRFSMSWRNGSAQDSGTL